MNDESLKHADVSRLLTTQDLLAGSNVVHDIAVPHEILRPGAKAENAPAPGKVRLRPLNIATFAMIARAAREDASLVPLLMIKEALVEPALTLDQIRQMHVGLVHFLVTRINMASGLGTEDEALDEAVNAPLSRTHILLAEHFGWTPEQVSQLTPGQVAVYLAGIEKLLQLENAGEP